jgi:hypothetical protein
VAWERTLTDRPAAVKARVTFISARVTFISAASPLFQPGTHPDGPIPPHDHRDNYNGGFAFAVYHPGTSLPQMPWAI